MRHMRIMAKYNNGNYSLGIKIGKHVVDTKFDTGAANT